ncbi:hypothetical protein D3C78_1905360 [compost metagenome]
MDFAIKHLLSKSLPCLVGEQLPITLNYVHPLLFPADEFPDRTKTLINIFA